jgi:hypothetical protein
MARLSLLAAVAAALAFAVVGQSASSTAFCTGSQLTGSFALVPGSPAAGSVSYTLRLRNRSASTCAVSGLPTVRLLGRTGTALPTHVRAAYPGVLAAVVRLAPSQSAAATARFSPDVPGVGETAPGQCEPKAYRLRVTARGGGTTTVAVKPATPVCEHGSLSFSNYKRA